VPAWLGAQVWLCVPGIFAGGARGCGLAASESKKGVPAGTPFLLSGVRPGQSVTALCAMFRL